jgi:hypothetical protein
VSGRFYIAAQRMEYLNKIKLHPRGEGINPFRKAQMAKRLLQASERKQQPKAVCRLIFRIVRSKLDGADKTLFGILPLPVACQSHAKRSVRCRQEGVQFNGSFRRRTHCR